MSRFHIDPRETVDIYEFEPSEVISDTPPNIITIKARMDVATAGKVSNELMKLGDDNAPELHVGEHVLALLLHNIVSWRGPDFDDLPCTPANIRALPSGDPFIEKVANEIGERNARARSPKAGSPTSNTSGSATASGSTASQASAPNPARRLDSGTPILHSPSVSDGRPRK